PRVRAALLLACAATTVAGKALLGIPAEDGAERGAGELADAVFRLMHPAGLYVFDNIADASPFAVFPEVCAFGLNSDAVANVGHAPVADWIRAETRAKRPAYVIVSHETTRPVADDGIVLTPVDIVVRGEIRCVRGKTFGSAVDTVSEKTFSILSVFPPEEGRFRGAFAEKYVFDPEAAPPFGLVRGGWDVPRRGKEGRWACDGAEFYAPVPAPGKSIDIEFAAEWFTGDKEDAEPQELRLDLPFRGECTVATVPHKRGASLLRWTVSRAADDSGDAPLVDKYAIRASRRLDAPGYPPALAARFVAVP
ncbi:MAG: hypothetical protein IJ783_03200, partial [Kiritimatiellae bacterium]|nr:hypothetical protein [Kiritimatiellia bacterium]